MAVLNENSERFRKYLEMVQSIDRFTRRQPHIIPTMLVIVNRSSLEPFQNFAVEK